MANEETVTISVALLKNLIEFNERERAFWENQNNAIQADYYLGRIKAFELLLPN